MKHGNPEYEDMIRTAAKTCDGIDYPNSTTTHATIAVSQILETCNREIGVFSRSFTGEFWNQLVVNIQYFLEGDQNRTFKVVTALPPCETVDGTIDFLRKRYPNQFSLSTVKKGILENPKDCINFIYGDDFASRYEESDMDAKRGLVSAIVNFGNKDRVTNLKTLFQRLTKHA